MKYKKLFCKSSVICSVFVLLFSQSSLSDTDSRITYEKDIKKIIADKCFDCHGSDSPSLKEFRRNRDKYISENKYPGLDTYEELMEFITGDDVGSLTKRLDDGANTSDGKPGSMYVYLGDSDKERAENLRTIKDWLGHWDIRTRHDIETEQDSDWLTHILSGESKDAAETKSVDEIINEIKSKIKAPKN